MSDGNFNRQLLPKTDMASGIRVGKAQMRAKEDYYLSLREAMYGFA